MNVLTLVRLELLERRMVLIAAAILGVLLLLSPLLPGMPTTQINEFRAFLAATMAAGFTVAMAFIHGAGLMAPDLKERRLGFYFARPLSATALWGGKLLGGVLLLAGTLLLTALPSVIVVGVKVEDIPSALSGFSWALGLGLLLMLGAHAMAVALRARSPWLILDLLGLGAFAWLLGQSMLHLRTVWPMEYMFGGETTVVAMMALRPVLLLATWVQVSQGRTDLRRSHRSLSLTLAGGLLLTGLGTLLSAHLQTRYRPQELGMPSSVFQVGQREWLLLNVMQVPGHPQRTLTMLFHPRTGKSLTFPGLGADLCWTPDGRRVAWLSVDPRRLRGFQSEVAWADLTEVQPRIHRPGIPADGKWFQSMALSEDGSRVAVLQEGRMAVCELATGMPLASMPVTPRSDGSAHFMGMDRVRLYQSNDQGAGSIDELDLGTLRVKRLGTFEGPKSGVSGGQLSRDATRIVLRGANSTGIELRDGDTGALIRRLNDEKDNTHNRTAFLPDGSLVLGSGKAAPSLHHLDRDGGILRKLELKDKAWEGLVDPYVRIRRVLSPTQVLCSLSGKRMKVPGSGFDYEVHRFRVDLRTGAWEPWPKELVLRQWDYGLVRLPRGPGAPSYFSRGRDLVEVHPEGTQRVVMTFQEARLGES